MVSGDQERKAHGIKMWRFGYATQLILSVGKAELGRFAELGLEADGGLEQLAEQVPGKKRHFLVRLEHQYAFSTSVPMGFFRTRSEARALVQQLKSASVRSLLVVSSAARLRTTARVFRRAFRKSGVRLTFVAPPEKISFDRTSTRAEIWSEFRRYLVYRVLF